MRIIDMGRHLLRSITRRPDVEADLDAEMRSYVELAVAERIRMGQTATDARRAVILEMGGVENVKDQVRDTRHTQLIESLLRDARFALRSFRRSPGFTVVAIVTLALGIGGTTAMFSVVDAVLVRPIGGVQHPERLVSFGRLQRGGSFDSFGYPDFTDYQQQMKSVSGLAAHVGVPLTFIQADERPVRLRGQLVTGDYFHLLGAQPGRGRLIGKNDDASGAPATVVISHDLWTRQFGGRADAVGTRLVLNGHSFVVVGVASPEFKGTAIGDRTDVWAALATQPLLLSRMSSGIMQDRSAGWLQIFGRLNDGTSIDRATAEAHTVAKQLAAQYPATNLGRDVLTRAGLGLDPSDRAELSRMLGLLTSGVALVLLIACLNVGGLMLVRSRSRRREMAARLALGASRGQLVRQLAVEALLLTVGAGALALTFASLLAQAATWLQPAGSVLHGVGVSLDGRMMAIAAGITLASAGLLTLVPAFRASRLEPIAELKATAPGSGGARQHGQRIMVGAQIAFSFALLVTGIMVTVAMERLLTRPAGFDPAQLVMVSIDLSAKGYQSDRGLPLYQRLLARINAEPAFKSASFAKTVPPLDWSDRISLFQPGTEPSPEVLKRQEASLGYRVQADGVAPAYFATLGIPLLKGRDFTSSDDARSAGVVIVNQSLAKLLWPNGEAVGRLISWPAINEPPRAPMTVIGVVADHRYTGLTTAPAPLLYFPVLQVYDGRTTIVARAKGSESEALRAMERVVRDVDPSVPTTGLMTMDQRMAASVWQQRMLSIWLGAFGVLALLLSLIGLYGVVSQSVLQRSRELSLRIALGASRNRLIAMVVGESVVVAIAGLAVGAPLAAIGTSMARDQLLGMDGGAVEGWVITLILLSVAIVAASYLPARRASNLNPADALKSD